MTKITDRTGKTACIGVAYYMDGKSTGDFSLEFLGLKGRVPHEAGGAFLVESVEACIEDAKAWAEYTGEYEGEQNWDPKVQAFGMERVATIGE